MNFFERFENLLDSHNISRNKLADDLQIRSAIFSEWKKNGNLPNGETAIKIAEYFNVSLDYLLTGEEKNNELSPDEIELLSNYRSLQPHDKSMLQIIVSAMASNQKD